MQQENQIYVSILILMDLVLLLINTDYPELFEKCFNPYFNGSSTSTLDKSTAEMSFLQCFNPYFNGSSTSTSGAVTCISGISVTFQSLF